MAINDYSFITSSVVLLMSLFVLMGLVSFTDRKRKKHLLLSKSYQHLMDDLSLLLTLKKQSFFRLMFPRLRKISVTAVVGKVVLGVVGRACRVLTEDLPIFIACSPGHPGVKCDFISHQAAISRFVKCYSWAI